MTIPTAPPPPADHDASADGTAGASGTPGADSGPGTPGAPASGNPFSARTAPPGAERFLLWVAGLGVARSDGWLGGVAAGIAARLRIDPLIVRGILVIAALFGLPAIFLYAVAWALLPDADGRVHVRDLLERRYEPVQIGILVMAVIGLLPTAPLTGRLFGLGYDSWSAISLFSWIVGLVLVAGLLFLIVRAASRTPGASTSDLPMASAAPTAPDASAPFAGSGPANGADATSDAAPASGSAVADSTGSESAAPDSAAPDSAAPDSAASDSAIPESTAIGAAPGLDSGRTSASALAAASTAEAVAQPPAPPAPLPAGTHDHAAIAAWRAQHNAWKQQDQAWRRQQQDAERAVRDQVRRERQAEATVFAAEAAERRRIRRASNPRAGFAYVSAALGLAIVVGAGVGLAVGSALGGAVGVLSAALVLAVSMIVAGLARRRSGFLTFLTIATLIGGLIAGGFATAPGLTLGYASISNNQSAHVRQPFGDVYVTLNPHDSASRPIVIDKGAGSTEIFVEPGVELQLRATVGDATVSWQRVDPQNGRTLDSGTWSGTERGDRRVVTESLSSERTSTTTVQPVIVNQSSGEIRVTVSEPEEGDE